jgi:hypothetical protein
MLPSRRLRSVDRRPAPIDPYLDFPREVPPPEPSLLGRWLQSPAPARRVLPVAGVVVLLVVGVAVGRRYISWSASASPAAAPAPVVISEATATLTSTPDGAEVFIDGVHAGRTPISLSLPVGIRVAELRSGQASRQTSLNVEAGKIVAQHVDFGGAPNVGSLDVASDPPGARVAIDGTPRGRTPLKVEDLAPGRYSLTISSGRTSVDRTVQVAAGATATVVVTVPAPAPVSTGWVAVDAPVEIEVFENGRHLGSGRATRIALPVGRHTLELVNRSLGVRQETTVDVAAGASVAVNVPMPSGRLSINALPWANVWIDGRSIGQTPLGNVSVALGTHEVIWRHPQHGERRQVVVVTAAEPVRLGIDWTR